MPPRTSRAEPQQRPEQGDKAMPGGIDLNAANLSLQIKRDGNEYIADSPTGHVPAHADLRLCSGDYSDKTGHQSANFKRTATKATVTCKVFFFYQPLTILLTSTKCSSIIFLINPSPKDFNYN